jgi:hypothetical protein
MNPTNYSLSIKYSSHPIVIVNPSHPPIIKDLPSSSQNNDFSLLLITLVFQACLLTKFWMKSKWRNSKRKIL